MLAELGGVEVHVHVDAARGCDQALGIAYRGRRTADEILVHPVHGRRVARLADAGDAAVLDADIALDDAEDRIDEQRIAQQHVQGAHGAVVARRQAEAVAQGLAAPVQALVSVSGVVVLDFGQQ